VKALRWHARGDVRLDEIPNPFDPSQNEIQLKVLWCGICGTDVEEWKNGPYLVTNAPLTLGHEISGEVIKVGSAVQEFKIGDRVGVDGLSGCGTCEYCQRNNVNLCKELSAVGFMSNGGLAEFLNVAANVCVKIPDGAPDEAGALAETLSVSIRALRRARFQPNEAVTVIGAGAVGLLAAQAARALGAKRVLVIEKLENRKAIARKLGFEKVIDPSEFNDETDLAEIVLECSGSKKAIELAIKAIKPAGRAVLIGISSENPELNTFDLIVREKEILGTLSHIRDEDFQSALDLIARGEINLDLIISDRVSLNQALTHGLKSLADAPSEHLKILVSPVL
jgi:(R,R)-butanediol dehydrogenase / meso-butanediol dehydrogenase / diacetyl reductase